MQESENKSSFQIYFEWHSKTYDYNKQRAANIKNKRKIKTENSIRSLC